MRHEEEEREEGKGRAGEQDAIYYIVYVLLGRGRGEGGDEMLLLRPGNSKLLHY